MAGNKFIHYEEYLKLLGTRIQQYRVNSNFSQQDLADYSGVSVRSISRLEQGASVQMESFIKIIMALRLDENLQLLIPDQTRRPSYYLKESLQTKKRVRKTKAAKSAFKWGDEL